VFLVASYVIGLWFSLRTHAQQIWETPLPDGPQQPLNRQPSLVNWRDNIPDEPFLKRIGERISNRFLRGEFISESPTVDRPDGQSQPTQGKRFPSNSDGRISLGSSFTPEDSAFVRNVAEIAAVSGVVSALNAIQQASPSGTPQATPLAPRSGSLPNIGASPKYTAPPAPQLDPHHAAEWDHGHTDPANADLAHAGGMGHGHDAPNWSRTKSSLILLGATILYAIIAGKTLDICE
jgi:Ca2+:H+ antiporter